MRAILLAANIMLRLNLLPAGTTVLRIPPAVTVPDLAWCQVDGQEVVTQRGPASLPGECLLLPETDLAVTRYCSVDQISPASVKLAPGESATCTKLWGTDGVLRGLDLEFLGR